MSIFSAGGQVVNTIVDTTEAVVDTLVDALTKLCDHGGPP